MSLLSAIILLALILGLLLCFYPAELSWLSTRGTRWLYDRAADNYEKKWQRRDYQTVDEVIRQAAARTSARRPRVLDLGCGTGRGVLVAAGTLGKEASYTAVDFSGGMLHRLRGHIRANKDLEACSIELAQADIHTWLADCEQQFDLVLCLEVGEFLPGFGRLIDTLGERCAPGARLVMTRPAGLWHLFFPGRCQRRKALLASLGAAGFKHCQVKPWRGRYELVMATR